VIENMSTFEDVKVHESRLDAEDWGLLLLCTVRTKFVSICNDLLAVNFILKPRCLIVHLSFQIGHARAFQSIRSRASRR
jgi:hypothetical protein